jgi:hypothetical protein
VSIGQRPVAIVAAQQLRSVAVLWAPADLEEKEDAILQRSECLSLKAQCVAIVIFYGWLRSRLWFAKG